GAALVAAGVIRRVKDGVRLLSTGELKVKLAFDLAGASKAALEKVEKAGGSVKLPEKAICSTSSSSCINCSSYSCIRSCVFFSSCFIVVTCYESYGQDCNCE
ncbi:MAG TPA: uL15 family ribosomal protein, partial [Niabella sp.]|nr:uL15 family ribosomal protein [Niabella sp.]